MYGQGSSIDINGYVNFRLEVWTPNSAGEHDDSGQKGQKYLSDRCWTGYNETTAIVILFCLDIITTHGISSMNVHIVDFGSSK